MTADGELIQLSYLIHKYLSCQRCTVQSPQASSTFLQLHLGSQILGTHTYTQAPGIRC